MPSSQTDLFSICSDTGDAAMSEKTLFFVQPYVVRRHKLLASGALTFRSADEALEVGAGLAETCRRGRACSVLRLGTAGHESAARSAHPGPGARGLDARPKGRVIVAQALSL